jgi:hypothetical protein
MGDDVYLLQLGAGHLAGAFSYGLRNFEVRHYLVLPTRVRVSIARAGSRPSPFGCQSLRLRRRSDDVLTPGDDLWTDLWPRGILQE